MKRLPLANPSEILILRVAKENVHPAAIPGSRGFMPGGDKTKLDAIVATQNWTPTYNNLTVGNGTVVARFKDFDDWIACYYSLKFGTTTAITGTGPTISTPVNAHSNYGTSSENVVGPAFLENAGSAELTGMVRLASATVFRVGAHAVSGTDIKLDDLATGVPFTWGTGDVLAFTAGFEPA